MIRRIEEVMQKQMTKDYAPADTKRDAHPKHTGLLEAVFTIEPGLAAELRVGLFAEPRSYRTWVRTSNASGKPQSDAHGDFRGFAIKLLDVPGEKIPESDEPGSQDFILLSNPTMPLGTLRLFYEGITLAATSPLLFFGKMLATGQLRVLKGMKAGNIVPSSPLDIRYWSTTPYLFGPDRAVKYSLLPTSGAAMPMPSPLTADYLTAAMQKRLAEQRQAATFDFAVQFRKGDMPIHDSAPRWDETESPFLKVATLTIPAQTFVTEERNRLAAALRFNPGHARVEHRPLGSINRARMHIYKTNSAFRQQRSGITPHGGA